MLFNMSIGKYSFTFCYVKLRNKILRHGKCMYIIYMYTRVKIHTHNYYKNISYQNVKM